MYILFLIINYNTNLFSHNYLNYKPSHFLVNHHSIINKHVLGVHCGQPPSCPFRPALYKKLPISSQFDNVYEEGAGFRYYELTLDLLYYFTVLGNTQEQ